MSPRTTFTAVLFSLLLLGFTMSPPVWGQSQGADRLSDDERKQRLEQAAIRVWELPPFDDSRNWKYDLDANPDFSKRLVWRDEQMSSGHRRLLGYRLEDHGVVELDLTQLEWAQEAGVMNVLNMVTQHQTAHDRWWLFYRNRHLAAWDTKGEVVQEIDLYQLLNIQEGMEIGQGYFSEDARVFWVVVIPKRAFLGELNVPGFTEHDDAIHWVQLDLSDPDEIKIAKSKVKFQYSLMDWEVKGDYLINEDHAVYDIYSGEKITELRAAFYFPFIHNDMGWSEPALQQKSIGNDNLRNEHEPNIPWQVGARWSTLPQVNYETFRYLNWKRDVLIENELPVPWLSSSWVRWSLPVLCFLAFLYTVKGSRCWRWGRPFIGLGMLIIIPVLVTCSSYYHGPRVKFYQDNWRVQKYVGALYAPEGWYRFSQGIKVKSSEGEPMRLGRHFSSTGGRWFLTRDMTNKDVPPEYVLFLLEGSNLTWSIKARSLLIRLSDGRIFLFDLDQLTHAFEHKVPIITDLSDQPVLE